MQLFDFNHCKGGWFIGNFLPAVLHTSMFEVCYKRHTKGEVWPVHYHKIATEYTILVHGKLIMNGKLIEPNTIIIMNPYEIAEPEFLEDCEVLIVKVPSVPGDKYEVNSPQR